MLPMMTLQSSDTALFETSTNSAEILPDEASQDGISFAAFFESGLESAETFEDISGSLLPPHGNQLPAGNPEHTDATLLSVAAGGPFGSAETAASLATGNQSGIAPVFSASGPGMGTVAGQGAIAGGQVPSQLSQIAPGSPVPAIVNEMEIGIGDPARSSVGKESPDAGLLRQLAMSDAAASPTKLASPFDPEVPADGGREIRLPQLPVASSPAAQALLLATTSNESPLGQTVQTSTLTAAPQLAQGAASSTAEPSPLLPTVHVPVKSAGWAQQIGERVLLMTNNQLQSAEIRLTPAELGPVRVQLAVEDGAANVTFLAQSAITREAIEQAMPRLRELLAENGLNLNRSDVSDHGEQNDSGVRDGDGSSDDAAPDRGASPDGNDDPLQPGPAAAHARALSHNGLVDTFV